MVWIPACALWSSVWNSSKLAHISVRSFSDIFSEKSFKSLVLKSFWSTNKIVWTTHYIWVGHLNVFALYIILLWIVKTWFLSPYGMASSPNSNLGLLSRGKVLSAGEYWALGWKNKSNQRFQCLSSLCPRDLLHDFRPTKL